MSRGRSEPSDLSALSDLAPELAEMLVSVACDIALVLDDSGVIRTVAVGGGDGVEAAGAAGAWVGQHWTDTFTHDTRVKATQLLDDLASTGASPLRHLSHAAGEGREIPIAYTAVRLGEQGPTLAVGRDLRVISAMQSRLQQAQHAIERDHWQRRQAETRYRLLFQFSSEPALIVDPVTFDVIDANRAAAQLYARAQDELIGKPVTDSFERESRAALCELLARARTAERVVQGRTRLASSGAGVDVSATAFDIGTTHVIVLRAHANLPESSDSPRDSQVDAVFSGLVKRTPDGVVICDEDGRVTLANASFRKLAGLQEAERIAGRPMSDWFGAELDAIIASTLREGSLPLTRMPMRRARDLPIDVEFSATRIVGGGAIGFIVRTCDASRTGSAGESDASRRNTR
ncbi:MAG TPA: PAS domain-containing protein [Rhodanobacteraceae bacterium]